MEKTPNSYMEVSEYCRYYGNIIMVRYYDLLKGFVTVSLNDVPYKDALQFMEDWWNKRIFPSRIVRERGIE